MIENQKTCTLGIILALSLFGLGACSSTPSTAPPTDSPVEAERAVEVTKNLAYVPDGVIQQKLDLYMPTVDEGPFPVILVAHPGGGRKEQHAFWSRTLSEEGYAVVTTNRRGVPEDGFEEMAADIFCTLAWIHSNAVEYNFDTENVLAWGHSEGAAMVAFAGVFEDPAIYMSDCPHALPKENWLKGVVALAGAYDYPLFGQGNVLSGDYLEDLLGTSYKEDTQRWLEASSIHWVNEDDPDFLIIHGAADSIVPVTQSQNLTEALQAAGVPVNLHIIPNADHRTVTTSEESL